MPNCKSCGTINPSSSRFCGTCGAGSSRSESKVNLFPWSFSVAYPVYFVAFFFIIHGFTYIMGAEDSDALVEGTIIEDDMKPYSQNMRENGQVSLFVGVCLFILGLVIHSFAQAGESTSKRKQQSTRGPRNSKRTPPSPPPPPQQISLQHSTSGESQKLEISDAFDMLDGKEEVPELELSDAFDRLDRGE